VGSPPYDDAVLELIDKSHDELVAWVPAMFAGYVDERVAAGEDRASAEAASASQQAQLFPDGRPAEGQHVMTLVRDSSPVGVLWMGRPFGGGTTTWYVFYVEVDEAHRGQGLGREAMLAAERWTREHDGTRIGLNVFGPNAVARSLYDSLGYQVLATMHYKDL
jgi:ribosomal protein S18 acetylase RimI-like enzyme